MIFLDKITLFLILASAFTNAAASTIMKYAYGGDSSLVSSGFVSAFLRILLNPWIMAVFVMFGTSFFFMSAALSRTELTLAYPMMSAIVYIVLLFVGLLMFGEKITWFKVAGLSFILIGITLLAVKN